MIMDRKRYEIINKGERSIREGVNGVMAFIGCYTPFDSANMHITKTVEILQLRETAIFNDVIVKRII